MVRPVVPTGGPSFFLQDPRVNLFPVDLDLWRRFDPKLDLTATHFQNGDLDRISDPDVFTQFTRKYQHGGLLFLYPERGDEGTMKPELSPV